MKKHLNWFFIVATFTALFSNNALALSVSPMVSEIAAVGATSRFSYTVRNSESSPIAIEVSAVKLTMDENGLEVMSPADDDILVFPPVANIKAGSAQVLQVQYMGDPEIAASQAYRVLIETIPVPSNAGEQKIGVSAVFRTLLNVVPENSEAALSVVEVAKGEKEQWNIVIKNAGNRYARLSSTRWVLSGTGDDTQSLDSQVVGASTKENLILPNSTRTIRFDAPEGVLINESTQIQIEAN